MHLSDASIYVKNECVELWYVRGADSCGHPIFWPSKITAEEFARRRFPDEDADVRRNRVGYRIFNLEA